MMEHTVLNGTTSTTTIIKNQEEWKKKKGFGPLILFTVLLLGCAFYAGQIRGSSSGSVTTRGATTVASLMYDSSQVNDGGYDVVDTTPGCVKSSGSYDPAKDYCFSCGGSVGPDDDYYGKLGYCWNYHLRVRYDSVNGRRYICNHDKVMTSERPFTILTIPDTVNKSPNRNWNFC